MELGDQFDSYNYNKHQNQKKKSLGSILPRDDDDDDRISLVPDELLHHIVSFIPKEEAPRTLILSKRWLTLWITCPFMYFKPHKFPPSSPHRFMNSVEKVLRCRNKSIHIQNFSLSIFPSCEEEYCCRVSRVINCISEVVRQGVGELDLEIYENITACELPPPSVANSSSNISLTFLKIDCFRVYPITFPNSFSFPSLKTMHLVKMHFYSNFAAELAFNCPKLENLVLTLCQIGLSPKKQRYNNSCHHVILPSLPNLDKASIFFTVFDPLAVDTIRVMCNVKVLCFTHPFLMGIDLDSISSLEFDSFPRLQYLTLRFDDSERWMSSFPILVPLLRSLHNLESLRIVDSRGYGAGEYLRAAQRLIPPNCGLSFRNLKWIEIDVVEPTDLLLALVRHFLAQVETLEKMTLVMEKPFMNDDISNDQVTDPTPHRELQALCASSKKIIVLSSPDSQYSAPKS